MRVVRLANFVGPRTGGIRTALDHWGRGYVAAGHDTWLIHPDRVASRREGPQGTVLTMPSTPLRNGTGYRLIWRRSTVAALMADLRPDVVEVSDRASLRWVGRWARRHGVIAVMISHEHLTGILQSWRWPTRLATPAADYANTRSLIDYDAIVCPSAFAAQEFSRVGREVDVVPLGVDLDVFRPAEDRRPTHGGLQIVHCGRLSREKNPRLSLDTVRELRRRGVDARLDVLGHGPMEPELVHASRDLPVHFLDFLSQRSEVAAVLSAADVVLAPGPLETFGLAALEALACGAPVVCPDAGALGEVVGAAGSPSPSTPAAFADAVLELASDPSARARARAQARSFTWERSGARMLEVHERLQSARSTRCPPGGGPWRR